MVGECLRTLSACEVEGEGGKARYTPGVEDVDLEVLCGLLDEGDLGGGDDGVAQIVVGHVALRAYSQTQSRCTVDGANLVGITDEQAGLWLESIDVLCELRASQGE